MLVKGSFHNKEGEGQQLGSVIFPQLTAQLGICCLFYMLFSPKELKTASCYCSDRTWFIKSDNSLRLIAVWEPLDRFQ